MTNLPEFERWKEKQLRQHGVTIVERLRLIPQNLTDLQKKYLASKRDDLGHDIPSEIT